MFSHGYTYGEVAARMASLLSQKPENIFTSDGFFNDIDYAFAIETAERSCFMKFKRFGLSEFTQVKENAFYPANTETMPMEQVVGRPVTTLVNMSLQVEGGTRPRHTPLRKLDHRTYVQSQGSRVATAALPTGYLWFGGTLSLIPIPASDQLLRIAFVPAPMRILIPSGAGGVASTNEYSLIPGHLSHVLVYKAAIIFETKRRGKRPDLLIAEYREAIDDAITDLSDRDISQQDEGVDLQNLPDQVGANDSDYASV